MTAPVPAAPIPAPLSTLTGLIPTPTRAKKLTAGQVAELFGVRVETVRRWADDGKLRCTRTLGGDRRFDAAYIEEMLQQQ
jgi:excisionase family DNA binding protein